MKPARAFLLALGFAVLGCVKSRPDEGTVGADATPAASAATRSTATSFTADECERLLVGAEAELSNARASAAASCTASEDCILVNASACNEDCPVRAISRTGEAVYRRAARALEAGACAKWRAAGCPAITPKPKPTCLPTKAACERGTCVSVATAHLP